MWFVIYSHIKHIRAIDTGGSDNCACGIEGVTVAEPPLNERVTNVSFLYSSTQQTRDVEPMLGKRWPTGFDAGPTLNQT